MRLICLGGRGGDVEVIIAFVLSLILVLSRTCTAPSLAALAN